MEEHTHISGLTGKSLNGMQVFPPLQHVRSQSCGFNRVNRGDFEIIGHENNFKLLQLKESILIKHQKPELNGNQTSVPVYLFA